METLKLDKIEIKFRKPNIIELFEMRSASGWATKSDGYAKLAGVLKYAEKLMEDKDQYEKALSNLKNQDKLSDWALELVKGEIGEKEKKQ